MEYTTLGKTGLRVSRMGFGGIPIQKVDASVTRKLMERLAERGVNYIDTARGYTVSESFLGEALEGGLPAGAERVADLLPGAAARARGVSFGDWARGERDRDRQGRTEARRQANRERQVDDEIAKIEGTSPRARSKWHRQRLERLKAWKANQDPANNPAAKEADALERKRDELLAEQNRKLDKIASLLEETTKL